MTAHPTEIMRRTLQHKYNRIAEALAGLDRPRPDRRRSARRCSRRCAARSPARGRPKTCGASGPRRSTRSARGWRCSRRRSGTRVPEFCRSLDRSLRKVTGRGLPLDAAPIRFGSWIGGDRDGNPSVTPDVTRRAALMSRWTALSLYAREIEALRFELSMTRASAELQAQGRRHLRAVPLGAARAAAPGRSDADRSAEQDLRRRRARRRSAWRSITDEDLAEPLRLCDRSLRAAGNDLIADGRLADVLRRVAAFGSTLVRLDVRQEAARHTEAVDAIARQLGHGQLRELAGGAAGRFPAQSSSAQNRASAARRDARRMPGSPTCSPRSACSRRSRATRSAPTSSRRPAAPPTCSRSSCCSARRASTRPLRVVPLFETARDLRAAADVMNGLLSIPWYRARVMRDEGRQEVMVGYSDSAKESAGSPRPGSSTRRRKPSSRRARDTACRSRSFTAAAAASAAAAARRIWRSSRSRRARSTARCA